MTQIFSSLNLLTHSRPDDSGQIMAKKAESQGNDSFLLYANDTNNMRRKRLSVIYVYYVHQNDSYSFRFEVRTLIIFFKVKKDLFISKRFTCIGNQEKKSLVLREQEETKTKYSAPKSSKKILQVHLT